MNISGKILQMVGWTVEITVPDYPKCLICVAPHTSNWDFIIGKLAYASVNRHAGFLMKSSWFFFPLGCFFRAIGGVPVYRNRKNGSLVDQLISRFGDSSRLALAITPEGTRSRTSKWHTGFLRIAREADVPILLGVIDYPTKKVMIKEVFTPSYDMDRDMRKIKNFYKPYRGKYPENFSTDNA